MTPVLETRTKRHSLPLLVRPAKRRKLSHASTVSTPSTVVERDVFRDTPTPVSDRVMQKGAVDCEPAVVELQGQRIPPLPDALLLLTLPGLILEPPSSPTYHRSLYLSWLALRRCSKLDLTSDLEVRAWTGLAEVGMLVLGAEVEDAWAKGVDNEVEKAIGKGLILARKHPTLSTYIAPLTYLQLDLAALQRRTKYAVSLSKSALQASHSASSPTAQWLHHLHHAHILSSLSHGTPDTQLAHLSSPPSSDPALSTSNSLLRLSLLLTNRPSDPSFRSTFDTVLSSLTSSALHDATQTVLLILAHLLFLVHSASVPIPDPQSPPHLASLAALPALLDRSPSLPSILLFADPSQPPLLFALPPKMHILALACLVAAVASRDASGRRCKRGLWAREGLKILDEPMDALPCWLTVREKRALEHGLDRLRAELYTELVSVSIMRSEFPAASSTLDTLLTHTVSASPPLFEPYSALLTLLHGRLAHALSDLARAEQCYAAAEHLAREAGDEGVRLAGRLGVIGLRVGRGELRGEGSEEVEEFLEEVDACGEQGVREASLVLRALLSTEINKSKQHLKHALDTSTARADNHARLLVLCITASHYLFTAPERALNALGTARQIALGLGASEQRERVENGGSRAYGCLGVGIWVGERCAEIYRRQGKVGQAARQEEVLGRMRRRWGEVRERWKGGGAGAGGEEEEGDVVMMA